MAEFKSRTQASAPLSPDGVNSASDNLSICSEVVLQTGGKAIPGVQSLWRISVGALQYPYQFTTEFILDLTPSWDDNWQSPIVPVSPTSITVNGQSPGSDGNAYLTLPNNQTIDLTVQAPMPSYTYNLNLTKIPITLTANGSDLVQTTPTFCVGQQINFALNAPGANYATASATWHLPATFVNTNWQLRSYISYGTGGFGGYYQPYGSVNYYEDDGLLQYTTAGSISTSCWYMTGDGGSASVNAMLTFPNGKTAYVGARGSFDIYKPRIINWDDFFQGEWAIMMDGNGLLSLGLTGSGGSSSGMSYQAIIQSQFHGWSGSTQLISGVYFNDVNTRLNGYELDQVEWFNPQQEVIPSPIDTYVEFDDEPWVAARLTSHAGFDLHYIDYLRFRPTTGNYDNNIAVTLATTTWSVNASETEKAGVWTFDPFPANVVDGPHHAPSSQFPAWTSTFNP